MAGTPSQPSSDDRRKRSSSEADLDDLITQVSDLTEEIAQEVGTGKPTSGAEPPRAAAESGSLDDAIDAELGKMEDAVPASAMERESLAMEVPSSGDAAPRPAPGKVIQLGKSKPRPASTSPPAVPAAVLAPEPAPPSIAPRPNEAGPGPVEAGPGSSKQIHPTGAVAAVAGVACDILDLLDRPFRWCGPTARYLLGWVAFGLFFAAAFLFLLTFFQ